MLAEQIPIVSTLAVFSNSHNEPVANESGTDTKDVLNIRFVFALVPNSGVSE